MNKRFSHIYLFLSVFTICLLLAEAAETAPAGSAPEDAPSAKSTAVYVLGAADGRVALFAEGAVEPVYVFEKRLASQPEPDREALLAGIRAADAEDLRRLIEAYTE